MISSKQGFLLLLACALQIVIQAQDLKPEEIATIFREYDTEVDEEPDCQPPYMDNILCPKDEKVPCSPVSEIEAYCAGLLGETIANEMKNVELEKGLNAMEGCMKYVGYHVVDNYHLACCESEHCDDWLEEMFANIDGYYGDDDEDDDYYEGNEF